MTNLTDFLDEELSTKQQNQNIEQKIEQKLKEYNYLISKEYAKYLVELESSSKQIKTITISEAKKTPFLVNLEVQVKKVYLMQEKNKGTEKFITQRLLVADKTGEEILVAFDENAKKINQKIIAKDLIRIGPVRYTNNEFRLINKGDFFIIQKAPLQKDLVENSKGNFEGIIKKIYPQKEYNTKNSEKKFMQVFDLLMDKKLVKCVYWDIPQKISSELKEGMQIRIENGIVKNAQIQLNFNSRIVYEQKEKNPYILKSFEIKNKKLILYTDSKQIELSLDQALNIFDLVNIPQDVNIENALKIKLSHLIGNKFFLD